MQASESLRGDSPFVGDGRLVQVQEFLSSQEPVPNPVAFILRTLRGRYLPFGILVMLMSALLGVTGFSAFSPVYESSALIKIAATESAILYEAQSPQSRHFDAFVEAELNYLVSEQVVSRVVAILSGLPDMENVPDAEKISDLLSVKRNGSLLTMTTKSESATLAYLVLNTVIDVYLAQHRQQVRNRRSYREQELVNREEELLQRIGSIKADVLSIGGEYGLKSVLEAHVAKISQLEEIDLRLSDLANTIAELETVGSITDIDTVEIEMKRTMLLDRALADMVYDRTKRAANLVNLEARYQPHHPKLIGARGELEVLDSAIESRRDQIATLSRTGIQGESGEESLNEVKALYQRLSMRRVELESQAKTLNTKLVELQFLDGEGRALRILLDETRKILDEVRVESRNAVPGVVEVVTRGQKAKEASEDKRFAFGVLGTGFGGVLAICLFFGTALLQPVIRYSDDLEALSPQSGVLGALPELDKSDAFPSAVNVLRNAIQLVRLTASRDERRARVIGLCGQSQSIGVTTLSCSLGRSFASAGLATLVVDGDMLQSGESVNGEEETDTTSWSSLLLEDSDEEIGMTTDGYYFLPAGNRIADPAVSLARVRAAFDRLVGDYDVILVDLGPFRDRLAASLVISQADLTLLVTQPGQPSGHLRRVLTDVAQVSQGAVELVLNRAYDSDPMSK